MEVTACFHEDLDEWYAFSICIPGERNVLSKEQNVLQMTVAFWPLLVKDVDEIQPREFHKMFVLTERSLA